MSCGDNGAGHSETGSLDNAETQEVRSSRRKGVVGVIVRESRFLVIRRSVHVVAPGLVCFPGGGIEAGETEEEALVREMDEELALVVEPIRSIWKSVTPSGTELSWWSASIASAASPIPNPAEVAEAMWLDFQQMRQMTGMLPSMPQFLDAVISGTIDLPWDVDVS